MGSSHAPALLLQGLEIAENGIKYIYNESGRISGEGFVEFANQQSYQEAIKRHRQNMGSRYIEVFPTSAGEMAYRLEGVIMPGFGQ